MLNNQQSLWKQILGAVVGGSIALALYTGYNIASPDLSKLTGIIVLPQKNAGIKLTGDVRIADNDLDDRKIKRIAAKAQQIAADFSSAQIAQEITEEIVEIAPIAMPDEQEIIEAWEAIGDPAQASEEPMWDENVIEFPEEPAFYGETDQLPDSGIGLWLVALGALAGATFYLCKRKLTACAN